MYNYKNYYGTFTRFILKLRNDYWWCYQGINTALRMCGFTRIMFVLTGILQNIDKPFMCYRQCCFFSLEIPMCSILDGDMLLEKYGYSGMIENPWKMTTCSCLSHSFQLIWTTFYWFCALWNFSGGWDTNQRVVVLKSTIDISLTMVFLLQWQCNTVWHCIPQ